MIEILLDPNIAYLFLVSGVLMAVMAVLSPGTGLFEIGALFAFAIAGWQVYNLPINWWALIVLLIGVFPFLVAVRRSGNYIYLGLSILALVIGSAFFFRGEGFLPAVNLWLALVVSLFSGLFMWVVTSKTLEAHLARPSHDLGVLVGAYGIARTNILEEGTVFVNMEDWSAQSESPIKEGQRVRVLSREGFVLQVEAAGENT